MNGSSANNQDNFDGLGSLIRVTGAVIPARALFLGETFFTSSLSALVFGLLGGHVGSSVESVGPLVPFLVGSWVGYSFGLVRQWQHAKRRSVAYCKLYPALMVHCLTTDWDIEIPDHVKNTILNSGTEMRFNSNSTPVLADWVMQGGLGRQTIAILAAQSCQPQVEEIQNRRRQRLVDTYSPSEE